MVLAHRNQFSLALVLVLAAVQPAESIVVVVVVAAVATEQASRHQQLVM